MIEKEDVRVKEDVLRLDLDTEKRSSLTLSVWRFWLSVVKGQTISVGVPPRDVPP